MEAQRSQPSFPRSHSRTCGVGSEPCFWETSRWRGLARQCAETARGMLGKWPRGSRKKALLWPLDGNGKPFSSLLPGASWVGSLREGAAFQNPLTATRFPGASRETERPQDSTDIPRPPEVSSELHTLIAQYSLNAHEVPRAGSALHNPVSWGLLRCPLL